MTNLTRFEAQQPCYSWTSPHPMDWAQKLRSNQEKERRRGDRRVAVPVLSLIAAVWFCLGLCLPGASIESAPTHPVRTVVARPASTSQLTAWVGR